MRNSILEKAHEDYTPIARFNLLINHLRLIKPSDGSEADRYYAIVITEVEKAKAVYMAYCQEKPSDD